MRRQHHAARLENGSVEEQVFRSAIRGVVIIAGISLVCNVGTLAVPLFNMQVFNRVLPTRDLGTFGGLSGRGWPSV